jgi:hypothetical protein
VVWSASQLAAAPLSILPQVKRTRVEHSGPRQTPLMPALIPQELAPPQEAYAAFPDTAAGAPASPAAPSACQTRLAKLATFQPIPVLVGPGECGAVDAVLLQSITLPDQAKVVVTPAATLRCPMAEQITQWVRDEVAPATLKLGSPLRGLDNFDSYECRGRNRVRGAKLSEHGRADALDVRSFRLADGRTITLTDVNVDKAWREAIKATVCARFSTILGPGSDGAHEEHIHLDLAERRNNYKICEWDVREPLILAKSTTPLSAIPPSTPPPDTAVPATSDQASASQNDQTTVENDDAAPLSADTVPLPRPRPHRFVNATGGSARPKESDPN